MWSRVILTRERIEEVLGGEEIRAGEGSRGSAEIPERRDTRLVPETLATGETRAAAEISAIGERRSIGARVEFQGIVRDQELDPVTGSLRRISALEYEAHEEMAVHQMEKIVGELGRRLPLISLLVIHRIGIVPAGEPSLFLRVDAPHRAEALEACAAFIDELKRWVPIWKHAIVEGGCSTKHGDEARPTTMNLDDDPWR